MGQVPEGRHKFFRSPEGGERKYRPRRRGTARAHAGSSFRQNYRNYRGLWYQKNANATRATVMIHSTMSLLRFFSSAIKCSTAYLKLRFKCRIDFPRLRFCRPPLA